MSKTVSVDPHLEEFLAEPLTHEHGERKGVAILDEEGLEEEEPSIGEQASTTGQRDEIYRLIGQTTGQNPPPKALEIVDRIKKLNFAEAQSYLECLNAVKDQQFSYGVTQRTMSMITHGLVYPGDEETEKLVSQDEILMAEMNVTFGNIISKIGRLKGPFMYGLYLCYSWLNGMKNVKEKGRAAGEADAPREILTTKQAKNNDGGALQIDGSSTQSDGKNHTNH